jgi:hypothetical protein
MSRRPARQPVHQAPEPIDKDALRWPKVDADATRRLPPVLRACVRALGWGRARDFLVVFGGQVVFVPAAKTTALGLREDELTRLRVVLEPHLSDTRCVAMPKADKLFLRWRDEEFARDMQAMSTAELARKYKLTTRHVLNLKRQCGDDDGLRETATKPGQMELALY